MREIKFRIWNDYLKAYSTLKGERFYYEPLNEEHIGLIEAYKKYLIGGNSLVLEQYTGLEDKNGVEIYEGDRLLMTDEVGKNGVVTVGFENGGFIVFVGLAWRYIGTFDELKNNIEVIGNIHEGERK